MRARSFEPPVAVEAAQFAVGPIEARRPLDRAEPGETRVERRLQPVRVGPGDRDANRRDEGHARAGAQRAARATPPRRGRRGGRAWRARLSPPSSMSCAWASCHSAAVASFGSRRRPFLRAITSGTHCVGIEDDRHAIHALETFGIVDGPAGLDRAVAALHLAELAGRPAFGAARDPVEDPRPSDQREARAQRAKVAAEPLVDEEVEDEQARPRRRRTASSARNRA